MADVWRPRLHPTLPSGRHPGGAPPVYRDETVLLTMVVLRAWRLSLEKIANWLGRDDALAVALGMDPTCTISAAQLSRRSRHRGLWPDRFFFIGLVGVLLCRGALPGRPVILDGSLLKAWDHQDPEAELAGRRPGRSLDPLPLLFVITPARWAQVAIAPLLLVSALMLSRLQIAVLSADAGSDTDWFVAFVRALGIIPVIDDNLRRLGKRFLATRFFLDQWRCLRAPRSAVERSVAFLKCSSGLKYFQVQGWEAVWRDALLVNAAMLAVALSADRMNRPDLMTRRAQVLAFVTN